MTLSRQNLRHIAYLLEVAPIAISPAKQGRVGLCSQSRLKRWSEGRRHFRTCIAAQKGGATRGAAATGRASAARILVSDNEAASSTTAGRSDGIPSTSSSPLSAPAPAAGKATGLRASASAALDKVARILEDAKQPLRTDKVVSEEDALKSLRLCRNVAKAFMEGGSDQSGQAAGFLAMSLIFSAERGGSGGRGGEGTERGEDLAAWTEAMEDMLAIKDVALRKIAEAGRAVMTDPKVFLTPEILQSYVKLRVSIGHPEDLADVFQLYATKLVPEPNSSPIKYSQPSPNKASVAIPLETAQYALDAAIATRNLPLCFDIISNSVTKTAFKRRKLIQQALVPFAGVAAAPFAAYGLASQFAVFQANLDTSTAKFVGFAGIMSYIAFTGTIGMVALTTSNDQMDRVVWRDGTPLRERWLRENERAMFDKVAVAWGFKDRYRRGEEEGPDWEALKELIHLRGMILDKVELMEGMS